MVHITCTSYRRRLPALYGIVVTAQVYFLKCFSRQPKHQVAGLVLDCEDNTSLFRLYVLLTAKVKLSGLCVNTSLVEQAKKSLFKALLHTEPW